MATSQVGQFITGLKSRNEDFRSQAVKDLRKYVSSELQEVTREEFSGFLGAFDNYLTDMVSSNDTNEHKGAVLAIGEDNLFYFLTCFFVKFIFCS